jgi:hypothetical protein
VITVSSPTLARKWGLSDMALKRVEKTGVYRYEDGSSVYLTEGSDVDERVLQGAKLDKAASKEWNAEPERYYFGTIQDAPQDQPAEETWSDKRSVPGAPENKAMPPVDQRSDADLAADAASNSGNGGA